jgi:sulfur carrier protein
LPSTGTSSSAPEQIQINVNGEECRTHARTLEALLTSLDFSKIRVATAVNGEFVPAAARASLMLSSGDSVEIVSARQGG